jgi:outer membrane protein assembly factor BamB
VFAGWDGVLHALTRDGCHVASVDLPGPARPTRIAADAELIVMFDLAACAVRGFSLHLEAGSLSCTERWSVPTGRTYDVRPLLTADRVCWTQRDAKLITCVHAGSGAVVWTQLTESPPLPGVISGGKLVVASADGQLTAFDPSTGQVVWRVRTGYAFSSPPALADDLAFIGGTDRALYAIQLPSRV